MKTIRFSYEYDKLKRLQDGEIITTIRKQLHNRYIHQVVDVHLRYKHLCYAKIVNIDKKRLHELSDELLLADVAPFAKTRAEAIDFINQFYRQPLQATTTVYILYLKRTDVIVL